MRLYGGNFLGLWERSHNTSANKDQHNLNNVDKDQRDTADDMADLSVINGDFDTQGMVENGGTKGQFTDPTTSGASITDEEADKVATVSYDWAESKASSPTAPTNTISTPTSEHRANSHGSHRSE
ncbi:Uu.00g007380.m01.CDS01 [Anthostomella pinea]|uniref:Uu.00g007380.m01.CDS01 n=1 Tax=Anthostomella pinea TaxID=933095 RepID=A0AAI8YPP5_9PEZI|nr:Uu.00g007380.m01.CDS01 [Anthostomella pinea]